MNHCALCGKKLIPILNEHCVISSYWVCKGCNKDVKKLFSLASDNNSSAYNKFKCDFLEDFENNNCAKRLVYIADKKMANNSEAVDKNIASTEYQEFDTIKNNTETKEPQNKKFMDNLNNHPFIANKLLLATIFAVFSFFCPCVGIVSAIIAKNIAKEIPLSYSNTDVGRARSLSELAIILNFIEILVVIICVVNIYL